MQEVAHARECQILRDEMGALRQQEQAQKDVSENPRDAGFRARPEKWGHA